MEVVESFDEVSIEAFAFASRGCVVIIPPPTPLISTFQKLFNNVKFVQFEYDLSSTLLVPKI
jgi:hypothetical protein